MQLNKIIKHPLSTEKSIRIMESENKLVFMVDTSATKEEVKKAVEETFKVKVKKVTTFVTPDSKKKAYVTLAPEFRALDVATDLGLM